MEIFEKLDDDNADIDGVVHKIFPSKTTFMLKFIDNNMIEPFK